MEITRKMSVAGINGIRKGFKGLTGLTFAARVFGLAEGVTREALQTGGEQWKFTGEFQAINQKGEAFAAPVLYLPGPADTQLAQAIKDAAGKTIKFGYDVFVEPDATSLLGYIYKVQPQVTPAPVSVLEDIAAALPVLTFPKQADLVDNAAAGAGEPAPGPASAPPAPTPAPAPAPAPAPSEAPKPTTKKK